jgi:hypothetical protein
LHRVISPLVRRRCLDMSWLFCSEEGGISDATLQVDGEPWSESRWSHVLVGGRSICRRCSASMSCPAREFRQHLGAGATRPSFSHAQTHAQIRVSRKQTPGCRLRCAHTSFLQRSIHPRTSPCAEHARLGSTTSFAPVVQPPCLPQRAPGRLPDKAELQ